jgi:hypothetical protein
MPRLKLGAPDAPEAVALREAAVSWAALSRTEPVTTDDRLFKRVDRALLRAALKYAEANGYGVRWPR